MALLLFNMLTGSRDEWAAPIESAFSDIDVREWPDIGDPADIEFLAIGRPAMADLPELPNLKLMLTMLAGVEGLLTNPHLPDGPLVKGEPAGGDPSMTEYAIAHIFSLHRQFTAYKDQQAQVVWQSLPQIMTTERRVGIMGFGTLSKPIVAKLIDFGFDVAAWTRTPKPDAPIEVFHGDDGLPAFMARTEIAVCMLPLTPETKGIFNAANFAHMPKGASIINLGRGPHVVDEDLIAALDSGQLSAASLDVTTPEPLPEDSPLWAHPRVNVMPHVSRRAGPEQVAPQFIENIRRFRAGEPLLQLVDRDAGY